MKKIRDFNCTVCKQVFEVWVEDDVKEHECKYCGGDAVRGFTTAGYLKNTTGKSPSLRKRK